MAIKTNNWKILAIGFAFLAVFFCWAYLERTQALTACFDRTNDAIMVANQAADIAQTAALKYAECVNYLSSVLQ